MEDQCYEKQILTDEGQVKYYFTVKTHIMLGAVSSKELFVL